MPEHVAHDEDAPETARSLEESAVRHGAYRWVERRLFELTGAWAAAPGLTDEARVFCFEASAQHAWHAELWRARLPVLDGIDPERLTRPAGRAVEPMLSDLAPGAFEADDESAGRRFVVGLSRVVLPLLLASYRDFAHELVPVTDAPAIRAVVLVVRDEEEELARAQALADGLLIEPDAASEAAEWIRALGEPLRGAGGAQHLLSWSEPELRI
jgi:hypothetical protein